MRIIKESRLKELAAQHGDDVVSAVAQWIRVVRGATWQTFADVRQTFRSADIVGDKVVFNIKGNDFRLIAHIRYPSHIIYIKGFLTHGEYDKGRWKDD